MQNQKEKRDEFGRLIVEFVWLVVAFVVVINFAFFEKPLNLYVYTISIKITLAIGITGLFLRALWKQKKST